MERRDEASRVSHAAAAAAGAVGYLSPLPGADAVLISPIQAALVIKLSSVYGERPQAAMLKAAGYAAISQLMGRGSARVLAALVPGFGQIVRGGVAVGVTEAVGWTIWSRTKPSRGSAPRPTRADVRSGGPEVGPAAFTPAHRLGGRLS